MIQLSRKRVSCRMTGIGGQGVVTAGSIFCSAAAKEGLNAMSNPFFGAEKRMAPAESYVRMGTDPIYERGEIVYPHVIMLFHPQCITMGKSYTMPPYDGIREGGLVVINSEEPLLPETAMEFLASRRATVYYVPATEMAIEIAGTELSTNMVMIGTFAGLTRLMTLPSLEVALNERFGKKFVASGGTASLDEAIKRKFAKKEELLQKNLAAITKAYEVAAAWLEEKKKAEEQKMVPA